MNMQRFEINGRELTVEIAEGFLDRLLGLMGRRSLERGRGLLLEPCNSVHMMFMRFPIDVIYLDEEYRIKKIVRGLRPWLGLSMCLGASSTLELPSGEADRLNLRPGQQFSTQ